MAELDIQHQETFLYQLGLNIFVNKRGKGHSFLEKYETKDFELVTNVCDNYSKSRMEDYFQKPGLAFQFIWFAKSEEGKAYAREKFTKY